MKKKKFNVKTKFITAKDRSPVGGDFILRAKTTAKRSKAALDEPIKVRTPSWRGHTIAVEERGEEPEEDAPRKTARETDEYEAPGKSSRHTRARRVASSDDLRRYETLIKIISFASAGCRELAYIRARRADSRECQRVNGQPAV